VRVADHRRARACVGTPRYMSPEQWRVARRPPLRHLFARRSCSTRYAHPRSLFRGADTPQILHNVVPHRARAALPPESRGAVHADSSLHGPLKKTRRCATRMPTSSPPTCAPASPSSAAARRTADKDADGDQDVTKTVKLDVDTEKTRLAPAGARSAPTPASAVEAVRLVRSAEAAFRPTSATGAARQGSAAGRFPCGG